MVLLSILSNIIIKLWVLILHTQTSDRLLLPKTQKILEQMGEQIKYARLRRKLSMELVAERAGISRATLWAIERGTPSVSIGMYAAVLHALNNMDEDLLLVAKDDALGRKLQDLGLKTKQRAPKKNLK